MGSIKIASRDEVDQGVSLDIDPAALARLKTLVQLAVAIGRREGLIGKEEAK